MVGNPTPAPTQSRALCKLPTPLKSHEGGLLKEPLCRSQDLPDSSQVAIIVHNVEVGHGAVALLLPGFILHLLQGYPLGEGINAQDFCGLQRQHKKER